VFVIIARYLERVTLYIVKGRQIIIVEVLVERYFFVKHTHTNGESHAEIVARKKMWGKLFIVK
jgi:hypothetical protein